MRTGRGTGRSWLGAALVFAVALAARVAYVDSGGGFLGSPGYDSPVYYTAADALTFGRLPYRDFTLLHPPGLVLALSPFALLGRLTSDGFGYEAARVAFVVLGALNAVLVVRVARRLGLPRAAALAGGLFYALCFGSVVADRATRLEPLGSALLLAGLLLVLHGREADRRVQRWQTVLAGACVGAAAMVKIWGALPLLVLLVWQLVGRGGVRRAARFACGAAAAIGLIGGPFLLVAPRRMWQMVVLDQLGRTPSKEGPLHRLASLAGVLDVVRTVNPASYRPVLLVVAGLTVAVLVVAWLDGRGRAIVVLAALQTGVLFVAPSYFPWYAEFVAPTLAVCVALAAGAVLRRAGRAHRMVAGGLWLRPLAWGLVTVEAAITVVGLGYQLEHAVRPPRLASLTAAVSGMRCVMSDDPGLLIQLNLTSRNLADSCPNWVDVTGRTYGPPDRPSAGGRRGDLRWQEDLRRYLTTGQAVITDRPLTGMNRQTVRILRAGTLLATDGRQLRVYAVTARSRCLARLSSLHHLATRRCRAAAMSLRGS